MSPLRSAVLALCVLTASGIKSRSINEELANGQGIDSDYAYNEAMASAHSYSASSAYSSAGSGSYSGSNYPIASDSAEFSGSYSHTPITAVAPPPGFAASLGAAGNLVSIGGSSYSAGDIPKRVSSSTPYWWLSANSPFKNTFLETAKEQANKIQQIAAQNLPENGCNANGCSLSGSFGGQAPAGPIDFSHNPFLNGGQKLSATGTGFNVPPISHTPFGNQPLRPSTGSFNHGGSSSVSFAGSSIAPVAPFPSFPKPSGNEIKTPQFSLGQPHVAGLTLLCSGHRKICVDKHLCHGGVAKTHGESILQVRSGDQHCDAATETCCSLPEAPGTSGTGPHQSFGTGFQHQDVSRPSVGFGTGTPIIGGSALLKNSCEGKGKTCVEKNQCVNGYVNTHGEGLFQVRSSIQFCTDSQTCCKLPDSDLKPTIQSAEPIHIFDGPEREKTGFPVLPGFDSVKQVSTVSSESGATSSQKHIFDFDTRSGVSGQGAFVGAGNPFSPAGHRIPLASGPVGFGASGSKSVVVGQSQPFGGSANTYSSGSTSFAQSGSTSASHSFSGSSSFGSSGSKSVVASPNNYQQSVLGSGQELKRHTYPLNGADSAGSYSQNNGYYASPSANNDISAGNGYKYEKPNNGYLPALPSDDNSVYVSTTKKPFGGYIPPPQEERPEEDRPRQTVVGFPKPPQDRTPDEDRTRQTFIRPTPDPLPAPYPGCAAALECVDIKHCTADGTMTNDTVILTKQQEEYRVPVTSCTNIATKLVGVCCRDPNYVDPWPASVLGQYRPDLLGFDTGEYTGEKFVSKYRPDAPGNGNGIPAGTTNQFTKIPLARPQPPKSVVPLRQPIPAFAPNVLVPSFTSQTIQVPKFIDPTRTPISPFNTPDYQQPGTSIQKETCGVRNINSIPQGPGPIDASFGEFPWQAMVLLQTNRSLLCGGAIIEKDAVVTAAHCVEGLEARDILIKAGEWKLGVDEEPDTFQIVQVKSVSYHPAYQPTSLLYDVAILHLAEKLRYDSHIDTICLPEVEPIVQESRQNCLATGWGKTTLQVNIQGSILHKLDISLLPTQECEGRTSPYGATFDAQSALCGRPRDVSESVCEVDIGSALACDRGDGKYELKGLYSWDSGCQPGNQITSFVKIDVPWIKQTIRSPQPQRPVIKQTKTYVQPPTQTNTYYQPQPTNTYYQPKPQINAYVQPAKPQINAYVQPAKPQINAYVQPANPQTHTYNQSPYIQTSTYNQPPKPQTNTYVAPLPTPISPPQVIYTPQPQTQTNVYVAPYNPNPGNPFTSSVTQGPAYLPPRAK